MAKKEREVKLFKGTLQVEKRYDKSVKFKVGSQDITAWEDSCETGLDSIEPMNGQSVIVKAFQSKQYWNAISVEPVQHQEPVVIPDNRPAPRYEAGISKDETITRIAIFKSMYERDGWFYPLAGEVIFDWVTRHNTSNYIKKVVENGAIMPESSSVLVINHPVFAQKPVEKPQKPSTSVPNLTTKPPEIGLMEPVLMPKTDAKPTSKGKVSAAQQEVTDHAERLHYSNEKLRELVKTLAHIEGWDNEAVIQSKGSAAMSPAQWWKFADHLSKLSA